jgi:2-keto-4-pentenoate hydratase
LTVDPAPEVVEAEVLVNGAVAGSNRARVDADEAARIVSALLRAAGERLEAGDLIIAGSIVQVAVAAGDEVVVRLGEVGQVRVTLS